MKLNRIYIIGGPGCGKSYAAKKLSELLNLPSVDLDNVYWDKKDKNYKHKTPEKERDSKLKKLIEKKRWIMEGVYSSWTRPAFEKADLIILIKCKKYLRVARILRRGIKKQFSKDKRKENFSSIIEILKWNNKWDSEDFVKMKERLSKHKNKVFEFSKADDAVEFVKKLANKTK